MNTNETIELTDLEPREEVVGGASSGFAYATLTVGGVANLNQGIFSGHNSGALRNVDGNNL
jgi:hypothetical protein